LTEILHRIVEPTHSAADRERLIADLDLKTPSGTNPSAIQNP
jgi:hypothetical protein